MNVNKPNRTNTQSADAMQIRRHKESGDQHMLPLDEPSHDPHRPQRVSRHDMHKTLPEGTAPDDDENT